MGGKIKSLGIKTKTYVKDNWGLPFIITFMFLLAFAAISFSLGFSIVSDNVSVFAFYSLFIGVILQIICSVKYQKNEVKATNDSS